MQSGWRRLIRLGGLILPALAIAGAAATAWPAEEPPVSQGRTASAAEIMVEPVDRTERQRLVQVGFLLLAVVGFVGLALLGLVVLWGFRLRRIARAPLPGVSPVDPLWYLRRRERPGGASRDGSPESRPTDGGRASEGDTEETAP